MNKLIHFHSKVQVYFMKVCIILKTLYSLQNIAKNDIAFVKELGKTLLEIILTNIIYICFIKILLLLILNQPNTKK